MRPTNRHADAPRNGSSKLSLVRAGAAARKSRPRSWSRVRGAQRGINHRQAKRRACDQDASRRRKLFVMNTTKFPTM
jgi:hypothetical protein